VTSHSAWQRWKVQIRGDVQSLFTEHAAESWRGSVDEPHPAAKAAPITPQSNALETFSMFLRSLMTRSKNV
jgi:hypothetical protein